MEKNKISWKRVFCSSKDQTKQERLMGHKIVFGLLFAILALSIILIPIDKFIIEALLKKDTGKNYNLYSMIIKIIVMAMAFYMASVKFKFLSYAYKEMTEPEVKDIKENVIENPLLQKYPALKKDLGFKGFLLALVLSILVIIVLGIIFVILL